MNDYEWWQKQTRTMIDEGNDERLSRLADIMKTRRVNTHGPKEIVEWIELRSEIAKIIARYLMTTDLPRLLPCPETDCFGAWENADEWDQVFWSVYNEAVKPDAMPEQVKNEIIQEVMLFLDLDEVRDCYISQRRTI
jgi:hypothetical protein